MIKQYYSIIKLVKVPVIVKRNSLAELIVLFRSGLSCLTSKFSLILRIFLWSYDVKPKHTYAKMVNSSSDGILLQFKQWSQIALLNVEGDIPIHSPDLTFKCVSISPQ